jgi:GH25 family lysozyme M1 (1,4-beta-N-acetylmuramidase)
MRRLLFSILLIIGMSFGLLTDNSNAQECLSSGFCTNITGEHQYPAATFSTISSTWTGISAYMNADNYTLFDVTSGNTYEWSYCEAFDGVSSGWDAQLTLSNNSTNANLCFSDNVCGVNGNAPYISWTATYTGVVKLLTSQVNCANNTGSPYDLLVWRMANGTITKQILGIDVSHYEGTVNWVQAKTKPIRFAWAKATEGTTYTDPDFVNNEVTGTAAGVAIGAYHFARPEDNTAAAEASYFLSVAGPYINACSLPPSLDLEDPPSGPSLQSSFTSAALTQWVQDWVTAVKTQTGITPVIYIGASNAAYLNSSINTYPLWMSNPNGCPTTPPASMGVWTDWAFKQYSWTGTVPGITGSTGAVDLDVFNGDSTAFAALLGCTSGITEQIPNNNFIIYPNPANNNITLENTSLNDNKDELILIYNLQGQLILQQPMLRSKTTIDISGFTAGMYFIKVKTGSGVEVKKFVKQ